MGKDIRSVHGHVAARIVHVYSRRVVIDIVGRRPVVFTGLVGIAVTTTAFGLSTSFAGIVASRFLGQLSFLLSSPITRGHVHISAAPGGLVAGNVAVIHSILAEITDDTNQDLAVPIYSLSWPVGTVIGFVSCSVFEST